MAKPSGEEEPENTAEWKPLWEGVRKPVKGRRVNEAARTYVEFREYPARPGDTKPRFEIRCTLCNGRSKGGRRVLKNNSIEDAFNVTTWTAHFVESCEFITPEAKAQITTVSKSKKLRKADGSAIITSGGSADGAFVRVWAQNPQEAEEERIVAKFREVCEKNAAVAEAEGYRKDQLKKNSAVIFLANLLKMRIPVVKAIVDEVDELDHSGLIDEQQCIYVVHQLMTNASSPMGETGENAHAGGAELDGSTGDVAKGAADVADHVDEVPESTNDPTGDGAQLA